MLVFYCYFVCGWSRSSVRLMMFQLFPSSKEPLVSYYGFSILLNTITLAVQAVFLLLIWGFPLFNNYKRTPCMTTFCFKIDIISLHNHFFSVHWPKDHHRENYRLHNATFILYHTKPSHHMLCTKKMYSFVTNNLSWRYVSFPPSKAILSGPNSTLSCD